MTLFNHFFQYGFVARDVDGALGTLRERYGVQKAVVREMFDWLTVALAWSGETMVEVIVAEPGHMLLYDDHKPAERGALRLHHLGFLMPDRPAWEKAEDMIRADGLTIPFQGQVPGVDVMYVDTRADLGLYTEYVRLYGEGERYFHDVPRND